MKKSIDNAPAGASRAKPFVKWVGGKRQLLDKIVPLIGTVEGDYYEPMVGGGAVFFELARLGRLHGEVNLMDVNVELVTTYRKLSVEKTRVEVIEELRQLRNDYEAAWAKSEGDAERFYYDLRAKDPAKLDPIDIAARFVFMNKAGFNGLYRVNSKGGNNVPWGRAPASAVFDESTLRAAGEALQETAPMIETHSVFGDWSEDPGPGDVVYFDPPYVPKTLTANFTGYSAGGFGERLQRALAELFGRLAERGVRCILSNSDTPLVRDLYEDWKIVEVSARRAVNSDATKRGKVGEVLVCANV